MNTSLSLAAFYVVEHFEAGSVKFFYAESMKSKSTRSFTAVPCEDVSP